jgi:hypothetical protein
MLAGLAGSGHTSSLNYPDTSRRGREPASPPRKFYLRFRAIDNADIAFERSEPVCKTGPHTRGRRAFVILINAFPRVSLWDYFKFNWNYSISYEHGKY